MLQRFSSVIKWSELDTFPRYSIAWGLILVGIIPGFFMETPSTKFAFRMMLVASLGVVLLLVSMFTSKNTREEKMASNGSIVMLFLCGIVLYFMTGVSREAERYYPLEEGLTWLYRIHSEGGGEAHLLVRNLPKEEINGTSVAPQEYITKDSVFTNYVRRDEEGFYNFASRKLGKGELEIEKQISYELLNSLRAGKTWMIQETDALLVESISYSVNVLVDSVKEEVNLNGNSFSPCIKISSRGQTEIKNGTFVATSELWYAKNVGIIKMITRETLRTSLGAQEIRVTLELVGFQGSKEFEMVNEKSTEQIGRLNEVAFGFRQKEKGLILYEEEWLTPEQYDEKQRNKGLIKEDGKWLTSQQYAHRQRAKGLVLDSEEWISQKEYENRQKERGLLLYRRRWITQEEYSEIQKRKGLVVHKGEWVRPEKVMLEKVAAGWVQYEKEWVRQEKLGELFEKTVEEYHHQISSRLFFKIAQDMDLISNKLRSAWQKKMLELYQEELSSGEKNTAALKRSFLEKVNQLYNIDRAEHRALATALDRLDKKSTFRSPVGSQKRYRNQEEPYQWAIEALLPQVKRSNQQKELPQKSKTSSPSQLISKTTSKTTLPEKSQKTEDLTITPLEIPAKNIQNLCWATMPNRVYILTREGVLNQLDLENFNLKESLDLGSPCLSVSLSREGIVVLLKSKEELWLIEERSFRVKRKITVPSISQVITTKKSSVCYALSRNREIAVIDLRIGNVGTISPRSLVPSKISNQNRMRISSPNRLALSPNGRYLFYESFKTLCRFRVSGKNLIFEEQSPKLGLSARQISVSSDSVYVALPFSRGNDTLANVPIEPYGTYIFKTTNLQEPVFSIGAGASPELVDFDISAGQIYTQNSENQLIVFDFRGKKRKEYQLTRRGDLVEQYLVHPRGYKLFVLTREKLLWVELER